MPSVTSLIKTKILEIDGKTIASFRLENGSITLVRKNGSVVPSDEGEPSVLLISNDDFSDVV